LTLDFNEAVATAGMPSLMLNDGRASLYDAAVTALLWFPTNSCLPVMSSTPLTTSLAVTGFAANGAIISDVVGNRNAADLVMLRGHSPRGRAPECAAGGLTPP